MNPRLATWPEFFQYQGGIPIGTAALLFDPALNTRGKFLRRVRGYEISDPTISTADTALVRARIAPASNADALNGTLAISAHGYVSQYAAGAPLLMATALIFEPAEWEYLPPGFGLWLYEMGQVSFGLYSAQLFPDPDQNGK